MSLGSTVAVFVHWRECLEEDVSEVGATCLEADEGIVLIAVLAVAQRCSRGFGKAAYLRERRGKMSYEMG